MCAYSVQYTGRDTHIYLQLHVSLSHEQPCLCNSCQVAYTICMCTKDYTRVRVSTEPCRGIGRCSVTPSRRGLRGPCLLPEERPASCLNLKPAVAWFCRPLQRKHFFSLGHSGFLFARGLVVKLSVFCPSWKIGRCPLHPSLRGRLLLRASAGEPLQVSLGGELSLGR